MNPWLEIPLEDYEGHMGLPAVAQAQFLAECLGACVQRLSPASVAVLGCAGGNGFEDLPPQRIHRVVGVDINPSYVAAAQSRYRDRFKKLDLYCSDLLSEGFGFEPVDLVFAGLLFEYVDIAKCLSKIRHWLHPGGHLCVILQLPSSAISKVSPSPFQSLGKLSSLMALVPPSEFESTSQAFGFKALTSRQIALASGKAFHEWVLQYQPA
ncbi:MAG: class I SAM-dependent methyltransferase [Acidobacteria bacterium]|nr:class I SAM-dependent methyltransferase [Acidobacteriota bacterium]MBI3489855.1 class I SAM-dependent methyltransferase [Acidobacteriota bacterium]